MARLPDHVVETLTGCANLLDVIKIEWEPTGDWSAWDQGVRDGITIALKEHYESTDPPRR